MIEHWLVQYGVYAVFLIIFFESFGLPAPGEIVLISASTLAILGKLDILTMLFCAFWGGVLGNCIGYTIGRYGGKKLLLRYGYLIKLTPEKLDKFESKLNHNGFFFIVIARFIIVARQLNGIIAGSGEMKFLTFFYANVIGAALWVLAWGAAPYICAKLLHHVS